MSINPIKKIRHKIMIPAIDSVEVVIGSRDPALGIVGATVRASFVCMSCDAVCEWEDTLFQCVSCGFEISPREALEICEVHIIELNKLARLAGKKLGFWGRLWALIARRY